MVVFLLSQKAVVCKDVVGGKMNRRQCSVKVLLVGRFSAPRISKELAHEGGKVFSLT
jgi:hypothetical protein